MSQSYTSVAEAAVKIINSGFHFPSLGAGKRVSIYLSPIDAVTPITVPAARRLLYAKALTTLLTGLGYEVQSHSLFADYDQPVKKLIVSIWLRYLELCGESILFPEDCYQGDYIFDFAATVHRTYSNLWHVTAKDVEKLLSQVHTCADMYNPIQEWLGDEALSTIQHIGIQSIRQDIRSDLKEIEINFDSWPFASTLLRDGIVTEVIDRLKTNGLSHSDGLYSYIELPPANGATMVKLDKVQLENEFGPTAFAIQLSHFLSVFGKEDVGSDLNICIYDIGEAAHFDLFNHCMRGLGNIVAPIVEKPISSPHLLELGDVVASSPLEEDFVSFREARQTIGWPNVQWLFAKHQSNESVQVDLSEDWNHLWFQQCGVALQDMSDDDIQGEATLTALDASQRQLLEPFLQGVTEFDETVNKAIQQLEPALLVNYYRNLCESLVVYYNKQGGEAEVIRIMAGAVHRILKLIEPIIGASNVSHDSIR